MNERVNRLRVSVPEGNSGTLEKTHRFSFAYDHTSQSDCQLSLTIPVRLPSYSRGSVHPIFEQNLPEGFVRERITERLRKHIRIDDMLFPVRLDLSKKTMQYEDCKKLIRIQCNETE